MTPDQFAAKIQPALATNPQWMGPTKATPVVGDFFDPEYTQTAKNSEGSSWTLAAEKAFEAVNPFGSGGAIGAATRPIAEAAAKSVSAGADAVKASADGIKSGFKWGTGIIVVLVCAALFAYVSPFLPRPGRG